MNKIKPYLIVEVPSYLKGDLLEKVKAYLKNKFPEAEKIEVKVDSSLIYGFRAYFVGHTIKTIELNLNALMQKKQVKAVHELVDVKEFGIVESMDLAIAKVTGLYDVAYGEVVTFIESGIKGMVIDLLEDYIGVIILGDYKKIKAGDKVIPTGKGLGVNVSEKLLGRHINPIGESLDGGTLDLGDSTWQPLEREAPNILQRKPVNRPLLTGIMAIDSMIPIGRGQRELIIGDRQTGKTSIALDSIIAQKGQDVICVYVAIGQQAQKIARNINYLKEAEALDYTIAVSATASDSASLQYLAPYTGMAIAEYFAQKGKDVLIIFDDLTKHAWAYRQISLLLKRPAGREAYPGDIFYLHSRLLERAVQLSDDLGGGSITALPIIETQAQDISAYIPTNVISITDGQIYLDLDLFNSGIKPAISVGLSVSRVGSSAQPKIVKSVSKSLRLVLSQYRELESFAQLGAKLDKESQIQLLRGRILTRLLKQDLGQIYDPKVQSVLILSAQNGWLDTVPLDLFEEFIPILIEHVKKTSWYAKLDINESMSDKLKDKIRVSVQGVVDGFVK